jgi:membrane protease YdiL (CAAX protease family)
MSENLDTKRIAIYLAFAFGIAWSTGLVIYLTGGLSNSPSLATGTPLTLALALLSTAYMGAPALAHVLTRVLTREGWRDSYLRPQIRRGWPYWVAAWFLPGILTILGGVVYFALFPGYYDPSLKVVRDLLAKSGQPLPIDPALLVVAQIIQAMLVAPIINSLFTFGEEFGWRAYLQPRLMPLGERRAFVLMGIIWGVWHWPVIAMGYNYGADYPGAPWLGMLGMVWFTFLVGTLIGWLALRAGSVWPAVIGHAAVNGIAGLGMLFVQGKPNLLIGPMPLGVVGSAAWAAVALWILIRQPFKPAEQ